MVNAISFKIEDLPNEEQIKRRSREIRGRVDDTTDMITTVGWDGLRNTAVGTLKSGLAKEDGLTWLARAWTVSRELEAAAIETLSGQTDKRIVQLASHPIGQTLHPIVTLVCAGAELPLEFTLEPCAMVDSIDLVVRRGWLTGIQTGRLTPSATLSFHGVELGQKTWPAIDLIEPYELVGGGFQIVSEADLPPEVVSIQPNASPGA